MIFQHFNLMPSRTIGGNVAYPLKGSGLRKDQIAEKVEQACSIWWASRDKENAYPHPAFRRTEAARRHRPSAGERPRHPAVRRSDERAGPADHQVDPETAGRGSTATLGITLVVITHEMAVVKEICNRVAVMDHGRVVEEGEVFSVFAAPREELTRSFIKTTSNLQKIEELRRSEIPRGGASSPASGSCVSPMWSATPPSR